MRSQADGVHHPANGTHPDQLTRLDRGPVQQALAVADRIDTPGLGLDPARLDQLLQAGKAGLIAHKVLAMLHGGDAQRRALGGNGRTDDHGDGLIFQDLLGTTGQPGLRVGPGKASDEFGLLGEEGDQFGAGAQQGVHLAVDVLVVQADGRETNRGLGHMAAPFHRM